MQGCVEVLASACAFFFALQKDAPRQLLRSAQKGSTDHILLQCRFVRPEIRTRSVAVSKGRLTLQKRHLSEIECEKKTSSNAGLLCDLYDALQYVYVTYT